MSFYVTNWDIEGIILLEMDMKNLHIAASPLTGTIFAGAILKDKRTWAANKKDMTIECLVAVAEHVLKFGKPVELSTADGTPEFRITVERLTLHTESK